MNGEQQVYYQVQRKTKWGWLGFTIKCDSMEELKERMRPWAWDDKLRAVKITKTTEEVPFER